MRELQHEELIVAMRDHERRIAQLSLSLASAPDADVTRKIRAHVVVLSAQLMKHRISLALLASRLDAAEVFAH